MWIRTNSNPRGREVDDCVVRALAMEGYDRGSSGGYGRTTYVGTGGSYGYQQGGQRDYDRGRSRGSDDEFMRHLQALKDKAPDGRTAQTIQRMIDERR